MEETEPADSPADYGNTIYYDEQTAKDMAFQAQLQQGAAESGSGGLFNPYPERLRLKRPAPETPVERLERRKADALKEVARLDELIQLFKANPATERILQLLGVGV